MVVLVRVLIVVLGSFFIYMLLGPRVEFIRSALIVELTRQNVSAVVHSFLLKQDPKIFDHCKVILGNYKEDDELFGYVRDEGDHIKVMGWVCAQKQIFWVSKKTKRVDRTEIPRECYIQWDKEGKATKECREAIIKSFP